MFYCYFGFGAIRECMQQNRHKQNLEILTRNRNSYTSQSFLGPWATILSYKKPNANALFLYTKSTHMQSRLSQGHYCALCSFYFIFFRRAFNQIDFVIRFELKDVIRLINPNQTPTPLTKVYVPFPGGVNQLKFTINTSTFHISKNSELCFFDTP